MGSTSWDRFIAALDPAITPETAMPLRRSIQPTAEIAWGSEFNTPPLADRAFACGGFTSSTLAPAVGENGGAVLAMRDITVPDTVPAWFWWKVTQASISQDLFAIMTLPVASDPVGLFAAQTAAAAVDMGAKPAKLAVHGVVARDVNPVGMPIDRDFDGWQGPFFKPAGHLVRVNGSVQQTHNGATFVWVELPNPR